MVPLVQAVSLSNELHFHKLKSLVALASRSFACCPSVKHEAVFLKGTNLFNYDSCSSVPILPATFKLPPLLTK